MSSRFGLALIMLGLLALLVFVVTYLNGEGDARSLLLGASLCALGLILRRRAARRNDVESGRFRMLRRKRTKNEEGDA